MNDRIVHAITSDGAEIVRYDRAGKWYLEHPAATLKPRRHLKVAEAAELAADHSTRWFAGRYGGGRFDALVIKHRSLSTASRR